MTLPDPILASATRLAFLGYALFLAGFFFYPTAPGHYRFYYWAVIPTALFLAPLAFRTARCSVLFWLLVCYAAYMLLAATWSDQVPMEDFLFLARRVFYVLAFILLSVYLLQDNPTRFENVIKLTCVTAAVAALAGMIIWYPDHSFPERSLTGIGRMEYVIRSAYAFGFMGILALVYFLDERKKPFRIGYAAIVAICLTFLVFTQSRAALLAFIIAATVVMVPRHPKSIFGLLAFVIAGIVTLWLIAPDLAAGIFARDLPYRPAMWSTVLARAADAPVFGHGSLSDPTITFPEITFIHVHSVFLATLRDGGIVGLALLLAMLGYACAVALRTGRPHRDYRLLALLAFLVICVVANDDRLFVRPRELWLYFWLPLAFIIAAELPARERQTDRTSVTGEQIPGTITSPG